ncbi:sugar phosphate isomerase/epimerase and 4-hydroxyphenylpyruvate domain-containing protein [Salinifilum aidingensis]
MPTAENRRAIATVCLSGTVEDKLVAAAEAGFGGVELFENDLLTSASSPEELRSRCADLGLSVDLYQPFRDFEAVPPEVFERNLRRAEQKFDVMERLGTDMMLVCSSVSPDSVDDDALAAEQLRELARRAHRRGIRIAYEALAWGRHVSTYDHAWRIVRAADHPALGVCLDSFHILSRGSDLALIRTIPREKLFFLQLADAPHLNMDVLQWSRHHRLFPGQGSFDLDAFTEAALSTGYSGPLSLEVFNDVFRQADPGPAAVDAMRSLRSLEESLHLPVAGMPPAPALHGYAFTEITTGESEREQLTGALSALGFARSGQHRSKDVQLWRQGDVRVLLNTGETPDSTAIGALALESTDPAGSAQRAQALLAPPIPRTHGSDEADLSAVAAPDGTAVFFCRTGEDASTGWLGDFAATEREPLEHGPGGGLLTGVDHVALTQPFDHFDEATLFYRSLMGLRPDPLIEYAAPFGMVRSRGMRDPADAVRLTLDGALIRRGEWAPGVTEPQHVAFSTDDVLTCAAAFRRAGGPLLPIPDNYYEDLAARTDLPSEQVEALRANAVLHDADEHGRFLHFYTDLLGGRVFFEVVQRLDGYRGFGAANAPVRMAAHRRRRWAAAGPPAQ